MSVFAEADAARHANAGRAPAGSRWRHLKTNQIVDVLGHALIEATLEPAVVYEHDHVLWVRPAAEFFDGRFEIVHTPVAAQGPVRKLRRREECVAHRPARGELPAQPHGQLLMLRGLARKPALILGWLVEYPGCLLSRHLALDVLEDDGSVYDRVVHSHVKRARDFLRQHGLPLPQTLYGSGWCLAPADARRIAHWARFGVDPERREEEA